MKVHPAVTTTLMSFRVLSGSTESTKDERKVQLRKKARSLVIVLTKVWYGGGRSGGRLGGRPKRHQDKRTHLWYFHSTIGDQASLQPLLKEE